jgi:predicted membrane protein
MKDERSRRDPLFSTRMLVGIWIIALGAILLAGNLGWIDSRQIFRVFWPLLLVFIGTGMVVQEDRRASRSGWIFIIIGAWVFFAKIGWIDINFWQVAFPLALLALGGMLVWRALKGPQTETFETVDEQQSEHSEFVRSFAVMSSTELRPVSRPFRGADLSAVMAGIKLDLTDARMEGDSATIEMFAFWGGMEIHVPPDWTVTSKVATLMGGFIDKRRPTSTVPTKTLVITGFVVMSGIEVKN